MSEKPTSPIVDRNQYRTPSEGTKFGMSQEEDRLDFRKYTGSPYNHAEIERTLASAASKKAEISPEAAMIKEMIADTAHVIAVREDHMEITERSFMKEAA